MCPPFAESLCLNKICFIISPMVRQSDPPASIEFGRFSILPHRRQLFADGQPIAVGSRAFDVLMVLIEAAGAVVGKDEFLRLVWQGRIVDESRLAGEIVGLRKAFGADRELIRTVAGRGYQFTGEIRVRSDAARMAPGTIAAAGPPGAAESDRASLFLPDQPLIAATSSPPRPRMSIVILPFLNLSQDPSEDYFVDGICDSLITDLSLALPGSFVISRSTAFAYKGRQVAIRQVGQELGVRYVLEGSVLAGARHVRVNAQLIDAVTDEHLWAERFDKERKDILEVQDEIVARLSRSVGIEMVRSEAARGNTSGSASDVIDLVMRARSLANDIKQRENAARAVELFRKALDLDPANVDALVGVATLCTYQVLNLYRLDGRDALLEEAEALLSRAAALASEHTGVLKARALLHRARGRFAEAITATATVIARNPGEPTSYKEMGLNKLYLGKTEEAVEWFRRADAVAQADPDRWTWLQGLGRALMQLGRDAEAVDALSQSLDNNPSHLRGKAWLAAAEALSGDDANARRHLAEYLVGEPEMTVARFAVERASVPLNAVSPVYRREIERIFDGLRRAGMAEGNSGRSLESVERDAVEPVAASDAGPGSAGEVSTICRETAPSEVTGHVTTGRLPTPNGAEGIGEARPGLPVGRQPPPGFAKGVTKQHDAHRRQITAMSCEVVGVAARADGTGLEDVLEAVNAFQHCVSEIVGRRSGFIASRLGNTVLVLFGYPIAHEHDAERAIRTGLELCAAVKTLRPDADVPMRCRVGIATGMVIVVGVGGSRDHRIVGDAPDMAVRLQVSAPPDTVTIASTTWRLIGNLFDCRDLGALDTHTDTAPIRRWHVLGESAVASRFEALRGPKLARLIGREEEIDLLQRRWRRAKAGDGQIVLVAGEAGLGKSRIAAAFEECLHAEPHLRLRYFCSPYHQDSALFPVIDQLGRAAGFARDDPDTAKLQKLEALLACAASPDEDVALLADLMSLSASERHPLPDLSPQRKKERTLKALIRQLEGLAHEEPVVTVWEDAHWLDPTSRELLDLTVERVRSLPVLLIVTFRPEFEPPWTGQPRVSMLALNRLDRRDRAALAAQIAGGKTLPNEVVSQIADRTDGVPLFVEELTKSVLESGLLRAENDRYVLDHALPPAIPTTLHASLLARLDRLESARHLAQIGAAIGREFSYRVLHAVARLPEDALRAALDQLVASELVFQRGTPPDSFYSFKHTLVQDAAYGSLLRNVRQQLHAQIAEALEKHSPEITESQPELLAQHYAEAGFVEKSVLYWSRAGHRSVARSAMAEALAQFQKGLDQLTLLSDTPKRQRQELEFLDALGVVLNAVEGHSARETGHAYARARELWERLGSPAEFLHVPHGQSRYHAYRGELDVALRLDQELLSLGPKRSGGLVLGHMSCGRDLMHAGNFASSRSHLEAVLALYDPNSHDALVRQTGIHPRLVAQGHLGIVLFCLGFPDQALARSRAAIAEAQQLDHPRSLAVTLALGARLLVLVGDHATLGQRADELARVATEQGFAVGVQGTVYQGWVKVNQHDPAEGMALLRAGVTAYRARRAELWMPQFSALLAEACEITGKTQEALTLLDDGLETAERTGARWFAPELNRQKGRLVLRQGQPATAEELYRKALGIAREQGAKLWELRAATSLVRLWRDQDRRTAARDLLAAVYGWFTEGFDTLDLKEAKGLLDELA
jgi:TolB-like protein/DNA-binding winged helix-turn-helix (wHTH) protein/class 3 adenylate cyclase/tetratricopeptide (TPR) repeat protein